MQTPILIAAIILYLVAMTSITWIWFRGDKEISKDELEELEQLRQEKAKLEKTLAYQKESISAYSHQTRVLATERDNLYGWGERACEVINKGSDMMTLEQLSRWEGCRGVLESFDEEEWRFPAKKEKSKASC